MVRFLLGLLFGIMACEHSLLTDLWMHILALYRVFLALLLSS
jgi:hypothetical protein